MPSRDFWKPNPKQSKFLSLPTSIKEAAYAGGAGSGKSDVLLAYGIIHRWHENPRFKQVFMRRTFPELRNEIVPRSRDLFRPLKAEFNKSTMTWTFPSGAVIILGHCENEDDVHQYDSMEINLFTPDEITSFTEFQYLYIGFTRVRTSDKSLPSIIRCAGMPGGIGHTWFKKRFVDPCPEGGKIIIGKGNNKRFYVHSTLTDNEYIDPDYTNSLEALPEAEKKAKKYGDWNAYLGQVFEEFRDRQYPDEPPNALHVIEPFDIPEWWPRLVAMDWGFRALTYVCYGAVSPVGTIYIYREQYWSKTKIEEWVPYVKEYVDLENPRIIKLCKSAGQDRGTEHTILEQVSSALGRSVDLTTNAPGSRVAGKQLIHEYFRWKPKYIPHQEVPVYNEEYSQWLLRVRGPKEYQNYLASFTPAETEDNLPKLQIFNNCTLLVETIKACNYEKEGKDGKKPEDVAEFGGDDPYDAFRYLVDAADRYTDDASSDFAKIKKQEELVQSLAINNDMTAFYRNARKFESSEKTQPMMRYRHAR